MTSGILALPKVWSGEVASMWALGETCRSPVEVEAGWVALASLCEGAQARAPTAFCATFADVQQQTGLISCPETVYPRSGWDQAMAVGVIEVVPP